MIFSKRLSSTYRAVILTCAVPVILAVSARVYAQTPTVDAAAASVNAALPHGEIQYLWPQGAPGALGDQPEDRPHLEIFAAPSSAQHTAVIVYPGGGYTHLAYDKEGTRIAEWLNLRGITAFVVTYRLAPRYHYPAPILDGERAVRWVRSHAAEYSIDPAHVGAWGFSAGGHLVGILGTHFDGGSAASPDPVERVSDRPDFVISSYGGLTLQPGVAKPGAMKSLLGDHPSPELVDEMSPDKHVTSQTPPFFLYATTTDQAVPVLSSVVFYTALVRAGVPAEMHIFEEGPHGTGLAQAYPELSVWPELLENWLRLNGWIPNLGRYLPPTTANQPPEDNKANRPLDGGPVTIVLVGDSTVATEGGWGPGFCAVMTKNVTCIDDALNGRSSKSFIDEGAWKSALAQHGDYYLIQFGHNDEKPTVSLHTDPDTTYAANIRRYIRDARGIGAVPVVISPLARRTFKGGKPANDDLKQYADAARRVAQQQDVTFIDLLSLSDALLSKMTQAQADEFDALGHPDQLVENGKSNLDRTHLDSYGQKTFGRMVADNLVHARMELAPYVIGVPAAQPQEITRQSAPADAK